MTRRRRERTHLEDAQERIVLATESGGIGIWETDLISGEIHWDAQNYRLHGMQPDLEPLTYALWAQLLHPDDLPGAEAAFQASLNSRQDFSNQYRVRWPDGSIHHIKGFGRVRRDVQGIALQVVGTHIDVTDAVHYAQSLEEARLKAEEGTQSKGQFLANMSHEIRTPMKAILGMLQLLGNTELTPNQLDYLNKTEGAAKSLLGLLNDILDFSKIDAGKMGFDHLQKFRENHSFH